MCRIESVASVRPQVALTNAPEKSAGGALTNMFESFESRRAQPRGSRASQARRQLAAVPDVAYAHMPMTDFAATRRVADLMLVMFCVAFLWFCALTDFASMSTRTSCMQ